MLKILNTEFLEFLL